MMISLSLIDGFFAELIVYYPRTLMAVLGRSTRHIRPLTRQGHGLSQATGIDLLQTFDQPVTGQYSSLTIVESLYR